VTGQADGAVGRLTGKLIRDLACPERVEGVEVGFDKGAAIGDDRRSATSDSGKSLPHSKMLFPFFVSFVYL